MMVIGVPSRATLRTYEQDGMTWWAGVRKRRPGRIPFALRRAGPKVG